MPPEPPFARPDCLTDALSLLASGPRQILAGGTDLFAATEAPQLSGPVLDISAIPELTGLTHMASGLRIGAVTSWSDLGTALPIEARALQQAARQIGGWQVQNAATIGGNLCNASPAADGVPPLLALDARVELCSVRGRRELSLAAFLLDARRTARSGDEILTAILLPPFDGNSAFRKTGGRSHLVISAVSAAARVCCKAGRIRALALAVGACSAVARRLPPLEARLIGLTPHEAAARLDSEALLPFLSPIDDHRATARYRISAAAELLRRALTEAAA